MDLIEKNLLNFAILFVLGTLVQQLFVRRKFLEYKSVDSRIFELEEIETPDFGEGIKFFQRSLLRTSITNVFAGGIKFIIPVVISGAMADNRASIFLLVKRVMEIFEKTLQSTFQVFYPRIVSKLNTRALFFGRLESSLVLGMILGVSVIWIICAMNPTDSFLLSEIHKSHLIIFFGLYIITNRLLGMRLAYLNAYDDIIDVFVIPIYAALSVFIYWVFLKDLNTYYLPLAYVVVGKFLGDIINFRILRRYRVTFYSNFIVTTFILVYALFLLSN
jgi:hypothetical protein